MRERWSKEFIASESLISPAFDQKTPNLQWLGVLHPITGVSPAPEEPNEGSATRRSPSRRCSFSSCSRMAFSRGSRRLEHGL